MMARSWTARLATTVALSQLLASSVYAQVDVVSSATGTAASLTSASAAVITSAAASSLASASASSNGTRAPKVYTVTAGAGGFKFTPQQISNVSVNDIITFEFFPPDHSVARAEYGSACVPYEYTGRNKTGFWSTTQWVNNTDEITHWNLTINSTEPIFFYCAAPKSCTGQHMVGVINPNDTQTLEAQIEAAKTADFQVAPGDPIPAEASSTLVNAPTVTATATASSTPAASSGSHKLSGGAIAGIVVGSVAFLVVCAALFFFIGRSKSLKEGLHRQDAAAKATTPDPHMSQYGHGGLGSPGFPSPQQQAYPSPGQSDFGYNAPPVYGQHAVGEQYPSGWGTPPPQHQQHASMLSNTSGMSQQQIDELKYAQTAGQPALAELHSPTPGQQGFSAELEAPNHESRK